MVAKNDLKATWMPVVSFLPLFEISDADSGGSLVDQLSPSV
jgi:hypothetical protein